MASNPANPSSKSLSINSSKPSSSPGLGAGELASQRRSPLFGGPSGSGNAGAGRHTRIVANPRNGPSARKRNKQTNKPHRHEGSERLNDLVDHALFESGAMRPANSRRGQNITHLMNFQLPPRPQQQYHVHNRLIRRTPTAGAGSGYHPADKQRYVHANYRFIVDPRENHGVQSVSADIYLDWNSILQILVSAQSQTASCPICLGTPLAPRMAKCGHIFCLSCLLRYMHSDEGESHVPEKKTRSRACPLCWDTIYSHEPKPVRWYAGQEGAAPREGTDITLRLVKRQAGSLLALPRDGSEVLNDDEDIPWYFAADVMDYARIMKGTAQYMIEQLEFEIEAIKLQEKEDELLFGDDTSEWVRRATRLLWDDKRKAEAIGDSPPPPEKPNENRQKRPPIEYTTSEHVPDMYHHQTVASAARSYPGTPILVLDSSGEEGGINSTPTSSPSLAEAIASNARSQAPSEYYFYQALLHYYLSPLDIRILKEAFGSFSAFPSTILPRVEHISTGHVVDDELRKRCRWLGHLPRGCEVGFLECDWTDVVSSHVLEKFRPEIERRRKRNEDKEAREERARARAERMEDDLRMAHIKPRREGSNAGFRKEDFVPLISAEPHVEEHEDEMSSSPPWRSRRQEGSAFGALAHLSTSPSTSRTVWGTPVIPATTPPLGAVDDSLQPSTDDGWLQGWEKDLLEESVIPDIASLAVEDTSSTPKTTGGKKKKAKKITLMSTNLRRGA